MAVVNGNEGAPIPYEEAVQWINAYKKTIQPGDVTAHLYGVNRVNELLGQSPDVMGIRIYYALNPTGEKKLIIFAVDANGDALESFVLEYGSPCPPSCGKP